MKHLLEAGVADTSQPQALCVFRNAAEFNALIALMHREEANGKYR